MINRLARAKIGKLIVEFGKAKKAVGFAEANGMPRAELDRWLTEANARAHELTELLDLFTEGTEDNE